MNCAQPGCTGQIVDGYCDVCGMAPVRERAGASAPPLPETPGGASPASSASQPRLAPSTATSTYRAGRRSGSTRTRGIGSSRLGAGLVEVPPVPARNPADAILTDPSVPENRRFCAGCDEPVGRSRDGQPGRAVGFCRKCGTPFSFEPKLAAGELVAGQYEVVGCLAHGGMGWVYLATDRNVSDRWVVLKGLLNAGDPDATAAALAERRFLAEVEHPNIVKIFNFVQHQSSGYIVMEYVGGQSLKQILAARREANGGVPDPLPPAQAIAYMLEILPALGYLHERGLVFCDFKLDNVIQTQNLLKLIDLGGVYLIDEPDAAVFGTVGYQAPEIATRGPSPASDLFTVARALAILSIDFRGYQGTYRFTLPPRDDVPRFQGQDSLYRLLLKGTAPDPDDRFQSAEEMAEQLYGVLREVVAEEEGRPIPAPSKLFTAAIRARSGQPEWRSLPHPQVSSDDKSAGYLATLAALDSEQLLVHLQAAPERTAEVNLRMAAAMIETGDLDGAERILAEIEADDPWEWRVSWYRGIAELARGRPERARAGFEAVYHAVPGELAPKLGLAMACAAAGRTDEAARWFDVVSRTDPSVTAAAFGLARCRLDLSDRDGALAAYERVPGSSSDYLEAQTARIQCLTGSNTNGEPTLEALLAAGAVLDGLDVDGEKRDRLTADLLEAALTLTLTGRITGGEQASLAGCRLEEHDLRLGLERCYRVLARRATSGTERTRLVDAANRTRPRTWT